MYFKITDDSLRNGKTLSVEFSIEYFDEGIGRIILQYDSSDEARGKAKPVPLVTLSGPKTWKPARVAVSDARFAGHCGAGDCRLLLPKNVNFTIATVEVRMKLQTWPALLGSLLLAGSWLPAAEPLWVQLGEKN